MTHAAAAVVVVLIAGALLALPARAVEGLAPGSLAPESAVDAPPAEPPPQEMQSRCDNCPPPRQYDSQETVRTRQDVHHTIKTVNTYEMAQPKAGQGGIRIRSDVTLVNFVVHHYRVIEAPALVEASEVQESAPAVSYRPKHLCRSGRYGRHAGCRPLLRVRG